MSFLKRINLIQYRNFGHGSLSFEAPVIGIAGKNGTGKTNVLDAIYYLCYTKSYFQSREANNVKVGEAGFRIEGEWVNAAGEMEQVVCVWRDGKKTVELNGVPYSKVTEHIGKYNAVMIAPDDVDIINGASEGRRKFVDAILAQSDSEYLHHLLSYNKILQQRNAYLRQMGLLGLSQDLLNVYDDQLSKHGAYLITRRADLSLEFPSMVGNFYGHLSAGSEKADIGYKARTAAADLQAALLRARKKDCELRRTTEGPHIDDWIFTLDGNSLKTHGSQGQKKSFLISLKLAHLQWLEGLGKTPILLLDDIFEKLDNERLLRLFHLLKDLSLSQIFMTHTSRNDLADAVSGYYNDIAFLEL